MAFGYWALQEKSAVQCTFGTGHEEFLQGVDGILMVFADCVLYPRLLSGAHTEACWKEGGSAAASLAAGALPCFAACLEKYIWIFFFLPHPNTEARVCYPLVQDF